MGFGVNNYCKIWSVEDKGKYSVANVSVSKKNQETGEYVTEFQDGYVRLVGNAHTDMQGVNVPKNGVSAKITSCDVTHYWDKQKNKTYTNYVIFGLELSNGSNSGNSKAKPSKTKKPENDYSDVEEDDQDLPF